MCVCELKRVCECEFKRGRQRMNMCEKEREIVYGNFKERDIVNVCVSLMERKRNRVCAFNGDKNIFCVCMCVCVCDFKGEKGEGICVSLREERERMNVCEFRGEKKRVCVCVSIR